MSTEHYHGRCDDLTEQHPGESSYPVAHSPAMRWTLVLVALAAVGCATSSASQAEAPAEASKPAAASSNTLFERLGGLPAIETVVDDFLARVSKDERINSAFAMTHVPRLRKRLVELLCKTTGGPCTYTGRDMKSVHAGMGITGAQFDALAGHLVAALEAAHVKPDDEKAVVTAVVGMRGDIVEEP